ncbi:Flp pilus assembly complex ATPase component TadA [Paraburkholderia sp. CNPSo 3274]|uniref:CpaF family protein n=1 Tax=unclassified Paraburkholderia TaxID=2615204 RepID=UPI0020B8B809|nr:MULTISPECIES: ATPase, T2SS/T4P/T4SS family [unclassified Paraburkholderia]MCP3712471.1 Flp pilus assembly complex ATPase component TadA [Paraburkholderia sp. CNPSo 3274]MCP3718468.1 Flp pilus assembly complex ATPase component TadA [Paraburkholderia sp. CNPSo 3281]
MSEAAENPLLKFNRLEESAVRMFFASLAPLREFLDAPDIAEVMVNNPKDVWIERRGVLTRVPIELNPSTLSGAIHSLASSVEKSAKAGTAQGILNAGHGNLRIAAVMRPTAIDGDALSIRKHRDKHLSLDDYVQAGAFSRARAREDVDQEFFRPGIENHDLRQALREIVRAKKNILVAGGTSSGKTTLLNAMGAEIPDEDRVITIEDTMELKLPVPNKLRLLSNTDTGVTTQMLVALCLRFRPDRILVGEVRSGEAYDFIQALNTGHDGGLGSIHSSTARGGLRRFESLAMLGVPSGTRWDISDLRQNIASCFNYVVHLKRTGEMRHLSEILEVRGYDNGDYILKRVF